MAEIPRPDAEFDVYATQFLAYVTANLAHFGMVAGDLNTANAAKAEWDIRLPEHLAQQLQAQVSAQAKDDARNSKPNGLEPQLRALRNLISAKPQTNNTDRAALGLAIEGEPEHPPVSSPPASRPVVTIDTSGRLEHRLRWLDETSGKKAKPSGIKEAEIRIAITAQGDPIPAVESFVLLANDTESPYLKEFTSADSGKIANYILRWIHRDGSHGSWSEIARATIVG